MRRMIPLEERFWSMVEKTDYCWNWTGTVKGGKWPYGGIRVKIDDKWRHQIAHRVSWTLHFGPIPADALVLHRCDNPRCVRPDHLFLGTPQTNMDDMRDKGRGKQWGGPERKRAGRPAEVRSEVSCGYCQKRFLPPIGNRDAVYCSRNCSNRSRKGLHRKFSTDGLASFRKSRGWAR